MSRCAHATARRGSRRPSAAAPWRRRPAPPAPVAVRAHRPSPAPAGFSRRGGAGGGVLEAVAHRRVDRRSMAAAMRACMANTAQPTVQRLAAIREQLSLLTEVTRLACASGSRLSRRRWGLALLWAEPETRSAPSTPASSALWWIVRRSPCGRGGPRRAVRAGRGLSGHRVRVRGGARLGGGRG